MALPNVGMDTTPFSVLTSEFVDDMIENIDYLASIVDGVSPTGPDGWNYLTDGFDTITYNGQRSYTCVKNGVDLTGLISPGQRLKTTRTVAAPTQCTSLNGTTQYWSKSSPNKLTFTNNFVIDTYLKLTSYAIGSIGASIDGTQGFQFLVTASGQLLLSGFNGALTNFKALTSYQSLPLNKWVRITAKLDMTSTTTTGGTNNYMMINGVDIPCVQSQGGTNPTSLVQAGNLNVGAANGALFFPGKIAQFAIYNAHVTQANIIATHSQGLTGTETALASAYSFNGVATDLNTTTPNDLTAQASAGYAADSPFGTQASGLISSTLDYGIVQSATFSTNTTVVVQVPEGCTIPTSGGVSVVSYSGLKSPYGFPTDKDRWNIKNLIKVRQSSVAVDINTWYNVGSRQILTPVGSWDLSNSAHGIITSSSVGYLNFLMCLSTANNTASDTELVHSSSLSSTAAGQIDDNVNKRKSIKTIVPTIYYQNMKASVVTGTTTLYDGDNITMNVITLENSYL